MDDTVSPVVTDPHEINRFLGLEDPVAFCHAGVCPLWQRDRDGPIPPTPATGVTLDQREATPFCGTSGIEAWIRLAGVPGAGTA